MSRGAFPFNMAAEPTPSAFFCSWVFSFLRHVSPPLPLPSPLRLHKEVEEVAEEEVDAGAAEEGQNFRLAPSQFRLLYVTRG